MPPCRFQELDLSAQCLLNNESNREEQWVESVEQSLKHVGLYSKVSPPSSVFSLCVLSLTVSSCVAVSSHVTTPSSSIVAAVLHEAGGYHVAGVCRDISVASRQ